VLKGLAKGALHAGLGLRPGGVRLYRRVAWEHLGTQASHVHKLQRVLPGYRRAWRESCGLTLDGRDIWVHEAGGTPFWALAGWLLTGRPVQLSNIEARMLDRHLGRAVRCVLACELPGAPQARRQLVSACRWLETSTEALQRMETTLHEPMDPSRVPLESESLDLCHSGGALEHLEPSLLEAFLAECFRVLRPGAVASHIFDHRDHLHHADRSLPFLAHLALPEPAYRLLRGNALGYHSRLNPARVSAAFERVGFERIALRRLVLPARKYAHDEVARLAQPGLPRWLLARRFREISELDLRTAAAHYLFRKPR